uniref:SIR2 family NAD-dependent protein deacylase n=2 Tax=Rothia TaxID=32207 RepID=UPI0024310486
MSFREELKSAFKDQNPPYLFVGSGFSKRYLGAQSWWELLEQIRATLGDSCPREKYADADTSAPEYAENMADDIKKEWWGSNRYSYIYGEEANRKIAEGKYGPIKQVACHVLKGNVNPKEMMNGRFVEEALEYESSDILSRELKIFKEINSPCLITTNYDSLLEALLEYEVYVGQDDLILSPTQGVGEIYKIHGDVKNPNSIILTKTDYDKFKNHDKYLHAKILTIFAENPIVFLGYSLSDENIRDIVQGIVNCIGDNKEKYESFSNRMYIIDRPRADSEPRIEQCEIPLSGVTLNARKVYLNNYLDLFDVLANDVKLRVPAKTMRFFRESLYAEFSDPKKLIDIFCKSIDEIVEEVKNGGGEKLIAGLTFSAPQSTGLGLGFQSMEIEDVRDGYVLGRDSDWNVYRCINYFVSRNVTWMPIHRYLNSVSLQDFKSNLSAEDIGILSKKIKEISPESIHSKNISIPAQLIKEYQSVNEVLTLGACKYKDNSGKEKNVTLGNKANIILKMDESKISDTELFEFISRNRESLKKISGVYPKLICLYDHVKYSGNPVSQ